MPKEYNRIKDMLFWEEKRKNCNCGSFALGVDSWFLPLSGGECYEDREELIRELYCEGYSRDDILGILLEKDEECILALCPWIEPIAKEDIKPEDTIVVYRLALELDEQYNEIDDEDYLDYIDEDFHFRIRLEGIWYDKCGITEIEICDEQDEDLEDPWHTRYGVIYDSEIRYFRHKEKI